MTAVASIARPLTGKQVINAVRAHGDLMVLVALVVAVVCLPAGRLPGIPALGIAGGAGFALQAMGIALVWRSNRIINFAQVQLGAVTAIVFYQLVHHAQFAVFAVMLCPGCFHGIPSDPVYLQTYPAQFIAHMVLNGYEGWIVASFWISLVISLVLAPLISWVVYALIIRRFERASRLIVMVVTIALAQVLAAIASVLPTLVFQNGPNDSPSLAIPLHDVKVSLYPATLHVGSVATVGVAVAAVVGLALFFRRSGLGVTMRAAADDSSRASMLGVNAARVSSVSWMLAGALSGLAAVLAIISSASYGQVQATDAFDVTTLVPVLAAVVFARMGGLWLALVASLVLGVAEQVFYFTFSSGTVYQILLLVIICVALLLQQSRQSRTERDKSDMYRAAREARPIPHELRGLPIVDGVYRWGAIVVAVVLLGLPLALAPSQVSLMSVIVIYAMVALSLLILTGWGGQVSLGQLAFAAVGGYLMVMLSGRFGPLGFLPVTLVLCGLAGAATAALVGIPALRLRGQYLVLPTIALTVVATSVLLNSQFLAQFLPAQFSRPVLLGFDLNDERSFYYVCVLLLACTVLAVLGMRRSRIARVLVACRDNEAAGQSLGISLTGVRLQAFAIAGFIAAVAGGLLALANRTVEPSAFSAENSVGIFLMAVIGGMGSVVGPLLGALYGGLFLVFLGTGAQAAAEGIGAVGLLLLFPSGLAGILFSIRDAVLRRIAIRRRIPVPSLFGVAALQGRAAIVPRRLAAGGTDYVPQRYRLTDQWARFRRGATVTHD